MTRLVRLAALLVVLVACQGPGVDCGPIKEPECSQRVEFDHQQADALFPGKTIWSIRMMIDGDDVTFTDGSTMTVRF